MSRIFVIDPVCAFEYGHNLNGLKYFRDLAARYFDEAIAVASRHLPGRSEEDGILRIFEFHYDYAITIARKPAEADGPRMLGVHDNPRARAAAEYHRFLQDYDIGPDDAIMFPSVDYYAIFGLLSVLLGRDPTRAPRLLFRFIAVMEDEAADRSLEEGHVDTVNLVRLAAQSGLPIAICAETPKYARRLQDELGVEVLTLPYASAGAEALPMPMKGPVTFLAGGSARPDKGYLRLTSIIGKANALAGTQALHFIVQTVPDHLFPQYLAYTRTLFALPNVTVLPGKLSYAEIEQSFADSHVALMPYDESIYEWRGSAMLMESMLFERLVLCQGGTGFSEQARIYDAGQVCVSDDEYAISIAQYARTRPARLARQAARGRKAYLADVAQACDDWIGGAAL